MLHLAQVEKIPASGKLGLRLIARQRSEYAWGVVPEAEVILLDRSIEYGEGTLVLATLSEAGQVTQVDSVNRWLIEIIQTFLKSGITPAFLQEESDRAEQWRQSLTLQSQDLDRRALELEARREQIEQLEETLKREKKQMETLAIQYKEQTQELDRRILEAEALRQRVEQLEVDLENEQKQVKEQTQELDRRTLEIEALRQRVEQLEVDLQNEQKQVVELLAQRQIDPRPSSN